MLLDSATENPDVNSGGLLHLGQSTFRWNRKVRERPKVNDYMDNLCNGAPGFVFLWTLAHRLCNLKSAHAVFEDVR